MTKILQNKYVLFTYGLTNYHECLVIVLSMSTWNCLEVIVRHCIAVPCGLIIEKHHNRKLTVAFNNVHRRMLNLPWRCSASAMFVNYNLPNLDTVIRRNLLGFIQRLSTSQNSIIRALDHSWHIQIKHRDC